MATIPFIIGNTKGEKMKVTYHAAKRYLQRVLGKAGFSRKDILLVKSYLEGNLFKNVVPLSYSRPFALPIHKGFRVIHRENVVITIVPKNYVSHWRDSNL